MEFIWQIVALCIHTYVITYVILCMLIWVFLEPLYYRFTAKLTRKCMYFLPCTASPISNTPHQSDAYTVIHYDTPNPQFTIWFTCGGVHSVGLDKRVTTRHRCCTENFTALKVVYDLTAPLPIPTPETTDLSGLPSSECHITGIIQERMALFI